MSNPYLPRVFGRYTLLERLGGHLLGGVYRARETTGLNERYAKDFTLQLCEADWWHGWLATEALEVFARRHLYVSAGFRSPWLLESHGSGVECGIAYVSHEGVHETVAARLRTPASSELRERLAWIEGLCHALATAHSGGLVHGALDDRLVCLDPDGTMRLDFCDSHRALRRYLSGRLPAALASHVPPAVDLPEDTQAADVAGVARLARAWTRGFEALPPGWSDWLRIASAADPAERFHDAGEMREALHQILSGARPRRRSATPARVAASAPTLPRAPLLLASDWSVGDVVEDVYEVKGILGEGGMARVYRVRHRTWGVDLAVKTPRREIVSAPGGAERFAREAETWVGLGLHAHVVPCFYVRTIADIPRVFAEFVDGGSLADWIAGGRLYAGGDAAALERILDAAIQLAWGLDYAHGRGLVHQDVKPANAMMTSGGTLKVGDFGLAQALAAAGGVTLPAAAGHSVLVPGAGLLTPAYCSPEQARGEPLSRRTDVWSWAVSVLEAFVGEATWGDGRLAPEVLEAHLATDESRPGIPKIPPAVAALLGECLRAEPAKRLASLAEAAERLREVVAAETGEPHRRHPERPAELNADALNNRALSLLDLGREEEADAAWKAALAADSMHVPTLYNTALRRWRRAEITDADALRRLDEICRQQGGVGEARLLLSLLHLERGDPDSAARGLQTIGDGLTARELREVLDRHGDGPGVKRVAVRPASASVEVDRRWRQLVTCDVRDGTSNGTFVPGRDAHWLAGGKRVPAEALAPEDRSPVFACELVDADLGSVARLEWRGPSRFEVESRAAQWARERGATRVFCFGTVTPSLFVDPSGRFGLTTVPTLHFAIPPDAGVEAAEIAGLHLLQCRLWELGSATCLRVFDVEQTSGRWELAAGGDRALQVVLSQNDQLASVRTCLWDVREGRLLQASTATHPRWPSERDWPRLAPDGLRYLREVEEGALELADVASGGTILRFAGHRGRVLDVDWDAVGRRFLCASTDGIRLWDAATGRCERLLTPAEEPRAVRFGISREEALSLGARLLHAWDLTNGRAQKTLWRDAWSNAEPESISLDLRRLAELSSTASSPRDEECLRLRELATKRCLRTLPAPQPRDRRAARRVWLSPDARRLLLLSANGLELWDVAWAPIEAPVRLCSVQRAEEAAAGAKAFEDALARAASARAAGDTSSWLGFVREARAQLGYARHPRLAAHWAGLSRARVRGRLAAVWEASRWETGLSSLGALRASHDGGRLAVSDGRRVQLWEVAEQRLVAELDGASGHSQRSLAGIVALDLSQDGHRVLTGHREGPLRLWDVESGSCVRILEGHRAFLYAAALSPDGHYALSASARVRPEQLHLLPERLLTLSDEAAGLHHREEIRLWDLDSGQCLRAFAGVLGEHDRLHIDADLRSVVWAFDIVEVPGGLALLWRLQTWDTRAGEPGDSIDLEIGGHARQLAVGADGRYAVAAASMGQGTMRLDVLDLRRGSTSHGPLEVPSQSHLRLPHAASYCLGLDAERLLVTDLGSGRTALEVSGFGVALDVSADGCWAFSHDRLGVVRAWLLDWELSDGGDPGRDLAHARLGSPSRP